MAAAISWRYPFFDFYRLSASILTCHNCQSQMSLERRESQGEFICRLSMLICARASLNASSLIWMIWSRCITGNMVRIYFASNFLSPIISNPVWNDCVGLLGQSKVCKDDGAKIDPNIPAIPAGWQAFPWWSWELLDLLHWNSCMLLLTVLRSLQTKYVDMRWSLE